MTGARQRRAAPLRAGDVLEVSLRDGRLAYLQHAFALAADTGGAVFRVFPGRYRQRPEDLQELAGKPEEYRLWWVGEALLEQGLAECVGRFPLPAGDYSPARQLFRALRRSATTGATDWMIYAHQAGRDAGDSMLVVPELTAEQRRLPILFLGPPETLQATLEHSADGALPPEELYERGLVQPQTRSLVPESPVNHFMIFPGEARARAASEAASEIGDRHLVVRPPGVRQWLLVVGTSRRGEAELAADARALGRIARKHRGVYDGHEVSPVM